MAEFDPTTYWTIPLLDTASTITLAGKLLQAAPKPLPPELRRPLKQVRTSLLTLQTAFAAQAASADPGVDKRKVDLALDNAWGGTHKRLVAWTHLPTEGHPERAEAERLLDVLFADGLAFLGATYEAEWAESDRRLRQIDAEGLGPALDRLAGKAFVAEIRRAHTAYGDALGVTGAPRSKPEPVDIATPFNELRTAIRAYARKAVGLVDEDDGGKSLHVVLRALAPIDEAKSRRRTPPKGGAAPTPEPAESENDTGASD
jgi:hypothetical protein